MFIPIKDNPAFHITLNVYNNVTVFKDERFCKIILKSFKHCEEKYGFKILNYVIMPTHVHFILYFLEKSDAKIYKNKRPGLIKEVTEIYTDKIKDFLKTFRSFTAKEILKILKEDKSKLLKLLILKKEKIRKHWYSLWQDGEYITVINSEEKLREKQKYIHENPIKEKLVKNIKDYKFIK